MCKVLQQNLFIAGQSNWIALAAQRKGILHSLMQKDHDYMDLMVGGEGGKRIVKATELMSDEEQKWIFNTAYTSGAYRFHI